MKLPTSPLIQSLPTLSLVLLFLLSLSANGQHQQANLKDAQKRLLEMAETVYSADDELVNGTIYAIPNPGINGDPYLNGAGWQQGDLYIHGKTFPGQLVKYDLVIDEMILSIPGKEASQMIMKINKSQVDSFRLGTSLFVNARHCFPEGDNTDFYELVYNGDVRILRKYRKIFIDSYTHTTPLGKFSGLRSDIFLLGGGKLENINRESSFLGFFTREQQKNIRQYMKEHHLRYRKATSRQMAELMAHCAKNRFF